MNITAVAITAIICATLVAFAIISEAGKTHRAKITAEAERAAALANFKAALAQYESDTEADVTAWLDTIKDLLDEETATNLQNEIEAQAAEIEALKKELQEATSITTEAWLGAAYCGGTYLVS